MNWCLCVRTQCAYKNNTQRKKNNGKRMYFCKFDDCRRFCFFVLSLDACVKRVFVGICVKSYNSEVVQVKAHRYCV